MKDTLPPASGEDPAVKIWPLTALLASWLLIFGERILTPWIQGVDPITRLVNIDQFVVVVMDNPWLPTLQALLRLVYLCCDTPQAYKSLSVLIALGGMTLFYLVVARSLGSFCAVMSFLYFFIHLPWIWVATGPYMEPLLLLFGSGAAYAYQCRRYGLARLLFVLATFSRPELLIAAPALILFSYYETRSMRKTLLLALLYLPSVSYYLYLKFTLQLFTLPQDPTTHESGRMVIKLFHSFSFLPPAVAGSLALGGILVLLTQQHFLPSKRQGLLKLLAALCLFYATFVALVPYLHTLSRGGARHTIFTVLPASIFAAIFLLYLRERFLEHSTTAAAVLITLAICSAIALRRESTPQGYAAVTRVLSALDSMEGGRPQEILFCSVDHSKPGAPELHYAYSNQILLYLRFGGVAVKRVACSSQELKRAEQQSGRPLLRAYKASRISKDQRKALTAGCTKHSSWYRSSRPYINLCF